MKNTVFSIIAFIVLLFAACQQDQNKITEAPPRDFLDVNNAGLTKDDILRIASKYDMQDSFADGYKTYYFKLFEPAAYRYMDATYVDSFLSSQSRAIKSIKAGNVMTQKLRKVKSAEEYFSMIEKDAQSYASQIKRHGSVEKYQIHKSKMINDYDIYMDFDSVIGFIPKGETYEYGTKLNTEN